MMLFDNWDLVVNELDEYFKNLNFTLKFPTGNLREQFKDLFTFICLDDFDNYKLLPSHMYFVIDNSLLVIDSKCDSLTVAKDNMIFSKGRASKYDMVASFLKSTLQFELKFKQKDGPNSTIEKSEKKIDSLTNKKQQNFMKNIFSSNEHIRRSSADSKKDIDEPIKPQINLFKKILENKLQIKKF